MKNEPSYQDSYRPNKELEVVKIQLRSQRSSENWLGMEQVQLWLQKDPEDEEIYAILLESVEENPRINEPVRILLNDLIDKGAL